MTHVSVLHVRQNNQWQPLVGQHDSQQRQNVGVVEAFHDDPLSEKLVHLVQICDPCQKAPVVKGAVPAEVPEGRFSSTHCLKIWQHNGSPAYCYLRGIRGTLSQSDLCGTHSLEKRSKQKKWKTLEHQPFPMILLSSILSLSEGISTSLTSSNRSVLRLTMETLSRFISGTARWS